MATKAIDREGVLDALKAIRQRAHALEQPGMGYPAVSVRSLHRDLGLVVPIEDVLEACVDGGFTYCLDHTVEASSYDGNKVTRQHPSQDACLWGPDQLRSRLDCVDWRVSR